MDSCRSSPHPLPQVGILCVERTSFLSNTVLWPLIFAAEQCMLNDLGKENYGEQGESNGGAQFVSFSFFVQTLPQVPSYDLKQPSTWCMRNDWIMFVRCGWSFSDRDILSGGAVAFTWALIQRVQIIRDTSCEAQNISDFGYLLARVPDGVQRTVQSKSQAPCENASSLAFQIFLRQDAKPLPLIGASPCLGWP